MKFIKAVIRFFDARDLFVFLGLGLLFMGIGGRFGFDIAMIVVGSIIIIKGLTKWV